MVIEIDREVFKERNFKGLNFFLQLCTYENRYEVYTEIDKELLKSDGFNRLDYDDQAFLKNNYNSFITNQSINTDIFLMSNYYVTVDVTEDRNKFTIDEALRYFIQPISIILENSKNDAYFINAIFNNFGSDSNILNYLKHNWIQFENAGGCDNIINFVEGKKQSFNSLPKTDKSKYLRCFVLMDSDKLYRTEKLSPSKLKTLRFLVNNNISRHILRKRSLENYVVSEAIATIGNPYILWCTAFNALSDEQKDYYSVEKGLCGFDGEQNPKKSQEQINEETNNLFDNILQVPINNNILISGLKHQGYGKFKENFPKLFEHNFTNRQTLKARANSNELEKIFEKICKLI